MTKFYIDIGRGEVRLRLTTDGKADYSAISGWSDKAVLRALEDARFVALQRVQKCDEWLEAWKRIH